MTLMPIETPIDRAMRYHTQCLQLTWRYLLGPMADAIPRVQGEYWHLLIQAGIVVG